jgi:D-3-phosphoglycerate dehydrogenase / 2-oxoglutarate reductase
MMTSLRNATSAMRFASTIRRFLNTNLHRNQDNMTVLIADAFSPAGMAELENLGMEVIYDKDLSGDSLKEAMATLQPDALVVRSTKVPKDTIDAAGPLLNLVLRAGAGYDNIDHAHAATKGTHVANCPGMNSHAVAELTLGLMLGVDRRLADGNTLLKDGKWSKSAFAKCRGMKGQTLGLCGFGNIGKLVLKRAQAFEMEVIVDNMFPEQGAEEEFNFRYVNRDELIASSDFLSFHLPATSETKGMINAELLGQMKDDAVLINTSRGGIMNEEDILAKLNACPNFWMGTDVFAQEPSSGKLGEFKNDLAQHPRVLGSHHIGASTLQSEAAIGWEVVRVLEKLMNTGLVDNCVNMEAITEHANANTSESVKNILNH